MSITAVRIGNKIQSNSHTRTSPIAPRTLKRFSSDVTGHYPRHEDYLETLKRKFQSERQSDKSKLQGPREYLIRAGIVAFQRLPQSDFDQALIVLAFSAFVTPNEDTPCFRAQKGNIRLRITL